MRKKSIVNGLWVGLALVVACFYPFYHLFPARYVADWKGLNLPPPVHAVLLIMGPILGLALLFWRGRTVGLGGITAGALTGLVAALIVYAALIGPAVVLRGSAPLFIYALEPGLRGADTFTRDVADSLLDIMRWSYLSVVIVLLGGVIIGVALGSVRAQPKAPLEGKGQSSVTPRLSPSNLWRGGEVRWGAVLGLVAGVFSFGSAFILSRRLVSLITGAGPWGYILFFLVCGLAGALGGVRVRSVRDRARTLPLPSKVEDLWAAVESGAHPPSHRMEGAFWGALVGLAFSSWLAVIRPSMRLAVLAELPLLSLPSGMVPWLPLTLLGAMGGWVLAARLRPEPTLPDPDENDLRVGVKVGILLGVMASLGLFTPVYVLIGKIIAMIQGQDNFLLTMSYSLGLLSAPLAFLFPLVLIGGGALAAYQVSSPPSRLRSRLRAGAVAGATGGAVFYVMFIAAALNVVLGDAALAGYGLADTDYISVHGLTFLHRLVSYLFEAHIDVLAVTVSLSAALAGGEALLYCLALRFRSPLWQPVDEGYHLFQSIKKNPADSLPLLYGLLEQPEQAVEVLPYLALYAQADGRPQVARLAVGYWGLLSGNLTPGLALITEALKPPLDESWCWTAEVSHLYRTLEEAARANSMARITALRPAFVGHFSAPLALEYPLRIMSAVVDDLRKYQHVSGVLDKVAYLVTALEHLRNSAQDKLRPPERVIFASVVKNWITVINNALREVQGQAQPEVTLKTRHLPAAGAVDLVIRIHNAGQGPAERLRLTLIPNSAYRGTLEEQEIPLLSAGEAVEQTWPLEPLTKEGFRVEFALRYDDRTGQDHQVSFADQVLPLHVVAEFVPMPNPYSPGAPLRPDSAVFFGREDVFAFVESYLAGADQQKILILIGERRTGKTSILRRLPQRLRADYVPVYIDGQSLGIDAGLAHFFRDLAWEIGDGLDGAISPPALGDFQTAPKETFERRFLPGVYEVLAGRRLLLLFDEFEELEIRVQQGKLPPVIFPYLRHLMQHGERLAFIFAGTHRLEEMTTDYWSVLFNIALYHRLSALDDTAARALIVEPVRPYHMIYDDLALDKMLRVTAGHPYFLQLLCYTLVNYRDQARKNYITLADVNQVLEEVVELGKAHFTYVWGQASSLERTVLVALAQQPEGWATHSDVARLLADHGLTLAPPTVLGLLERLAQRDLVTEQVGERARFRLKMALTGLWMRRFKSLNEVVEQII